MFGETPYAEFTGDRPTLEFSPDDKSDLALLKRLKAAGIPVVAVFLSGRPLWIAPEINASDAFVAAFLPGTEGGGIADVLIGDAAGKPRTDFHGKLSFSWPKRVDQYVLNRRDPEYDPQFPFGYGLSYAQATTVPLLSEAKPATSAGDQNALFVRGRVAGGARLDATAGARIARVDRNAQEDSLRLSFPGTVAIEEAHPIDVSRESNGLLSLVIDYRITAAPTGSIMLGMEGGKLVALPIKGSLQGPVGEWRSLAVPLRCFADAGVDMAKITRPMVLTSDDAAGVDISIARIASAPPGPAGCGN